MSRRNRIVTAVAIGTLGIAGPVATASAATNSVGLTAPTMIGLPLIGPQPNPAQAPSIAAQGGLQAGAQAAAAGWQAGLTEAQTGNAFLAGAQAAMGGWQAGITAAKAGMTAGAVALGIPVTGGLGLGSGF
jgi:hypothetical protein